MLRDVRSQEQAHATHVQAQQLEASQVSGLREGVQDHCSPNQAHGGARRAGQPARVQPLRLQGAHQALPKDPLHQETHGGLQLQVRAVREDVQGAVGLHDSREGPRHRVVRVRHLRLVLPEQELAVLSQALQAQDEGEEIPLSHVQEEVQDAEELGQSHGTAQDQVRLRAVWHGVQNEIRPDQTPEDSLRREVLPVRDLRENVRLPQLPEDSPVDARRRKAVRMRHLRPEFHAEVADDAAPQEASRCASAATADQNNQPVARCAGQNNREQERQVTSTRTRSRAMGDAFCIFLFFYVRTLERGGICDRGHRPLERIVKISFETFCEVVQCSVKSLSSCMNWNYKYK